MTKKDYAGLAANILMLVGGAENISFCEHCMTRLRFNVKDRSLVRDEELNELDGDSGIIGTTKKNLDFTGVSLA